MKFILLTILSILPIAFVANAGERIVLSEDQAKSIGIIQVRALNVNDDVLTVTRTGLEPAYSIASIEHLAYDVYQISVNRMAPGQTCQQSIVVDDSTGKLDSVQVSKCD